jgi:hypothetical protein
MVGLRWLAWLDPFFLHTVVLVVNTLQHKNVDLGENIRIMGRMTEQELIKALEAREGGSVAVARTLGVPQQVWTNWKARGMPANGHLRAWLALTAPRILSRWLKEGRQ